MNAFDKVIGYDAIKNELLQICDMIHNTDVYYQMGAKMPHGVLLFGNPGLGKTLIANCFIEESGLPAYTVRRNKSRADFIREITNTFRRAKENAPSIVFLDDMDKFANEDHSHCDAEEYVAVQAGIDEVKNFGVFVLATANDISKLPRSLRRSGRFDRHIEILSPSKRDACDIIKHYLRGKKVAEDVNLEDVAKMINYSSCAVLETILNEAAIRAAYRREDQITMGDLIGAVLRLEYCSPDDHAESSMDEMRKVALHEAGHLVVLEALSPGSVGLVSLRAKGREATNGFVRKCKPLKRRPHYILVSLAGKAAVELYYSETCASGCHSDLETAWEHIRASLTESGACGLGLVDGDCRHGSSLTDFSNARIEAALYAELERYMFKARDILLKNRDFLEKISEALLAKETLLYSDIQAIRETVTVTEFVI